MRAGSRARRGLLAAWRADEGLAISAPPAADAAPR